MALDVKRVFDALKAAKYTGSNSGDLNAEISNFTVVSENASGLTFTSNGVTYAVIPGGYVAWHEGVVTEVFQNTDDYQDAFYELNDTPLNHVHDLTTGKGRLVA